MNKKAQLHLVGEECLRLATELKACLQEERTALIELRTETIVQTNFRKEDLGRQLAEQRKLFSALAHEVGELPEKWTERWSPAWAGIESQCRENQKFIQHSLRNLGLIVDNLKRLFGERSTYSPTGKKQETTSSGKMTEASY